MIDDKKIEEAAFDLYKNSKLDFVSSESVEGFKEGAKWMQEEFLKDLLHPASEEPKGYDEWIFIHYNVRNYYSLAQVKEFKSWKEFVERAPIKEWLYIDALFK